MATYTTHYNLKKPASGDYVNVADLNGNADIIDTELYDKVDKETGKGLSANDYTDEDKAKLTELSQYVAAGIIFDTASSSMASFSDGGDSLPVKNVSVDVDPVQDLHDYTKPWTGGAGKNLLQITATTQTINGVTFTVNADGSVKVNGRATERIIFTLNNNLENYLVNGTAHTLSGSPVNSDSSKWKLRVYNVGDSIDVGSGVTFTFYNDREQRKADIVVYSGTTMSNVVFWPMIRLASVSDATFEPYSNICPITGHTSATVTRAGKNWLNVEQSSSSAFTRNGEVFKNTNTDTRDYFYFNIKNGNAGTLLYSQQVRTTGKIVTSDFTISADTTDLIIKHSGASHDLLVAFPQLIKAGTYKAVLEITGYNPSVVGGLSFKNVMLISPTDNTDFEPYQGHVYNITFPTAAGTVYGGTLDLNAGRLTVDKANIASYSGQSINTPWLSSMDEYAAGRRPTTGAQVVYPLTTPITYNFTAEEITTLLGINHVWANTGDVSVEYAADPKLYINKVIANALNA